MPRMRVELLLLLLSLFFQSVHFNPMPVYPAIEFRPLAPWLRLALLPCRNITSTPYMGRHPCCLPVASV